MSVPTTKYNSLIEIVTEKGIKYIDKKFRLPFSIRDEAEDIRQRVLLHRLGFSKIHVPTSELVNIEVVPGQEGFWLSLREVFAGVDFLDVVNAENFTMYLDRLLDDIFAPLLTASSDEYMPAGIDPVMRNFVYDNQKGEFCYVDFMPPKVFYKGKYTQEIPECPDEDFYNVRIFAHNFKPGMVYVTYINLVREFPDKLQIIAARLEQFLTKLELSAYYRFIENSPVYRAHEPHSLIEALSKLTDWKESNYYLLREIANWIVFRSPEKTELKDQVYKLTSQERDPESADYGRISQQNFERVKDILHTGLMDIK